MNRKQKLAILVGIALIVTMGFFPPWKASTSSTGSMRFCCCLFFSSAATAEAMADEGWQ